MFQFPLFVVLFFIATHTHSFITVKKKSNSFISRQHTRVIAVPSKLTSMKSTVSEYQAKAKLFCGNVTDDILNYVVLAIQEESIRHKIEMNVMEMKMTIQKNYYLKQLSIVSQRYVTKTKFLLFSSTVTLVISLHADMCCNYSLRLS